MRRLSSRDLSGTAPAHFMFASPRIQLSPDVTRYARDSFPPGRGILEASRDLIRRIRADFDYEPETTDINTPLAQAFAERHGVCQDFAHVMIAGLRGLGLPAAYVSGYLRTIPPPGKPRLQGADATHAWVSVWCGASDGWHGFDPTNAIEVGQRSYRFGGRAGFFRCLAGRRRICRFRRHRARSRGRCYSRRVAVSGI